MASDFYDSKHQHIFRAIEQMHGKHQSVDMLTVEYLQNQEVIEQAGGDVYIYALADQAPSASDITAYAEIIRNKAVSDPYSKWPQRLLTQCIIQTEEALSHY